MNEAVLQEIKAAVNGTQTLMLELRSELREHARGDEERHGQMMAAVALIDKKTAVLEAEKARLSERVTELESEAEVTGVHSVEELRHKYRTAKAFNGRIVWAFAAGVLTFLGHKFLGWP